MDLIERFKKYDDLFLENKKGVNWRFGTKRPDLHAFMLFDSLFPGPNKHGFYVDMVSYSGHEEIFLEVDPEELNKVISDGQIEELVRCGVRYNEYTNDALAMFV